MNPNRDITMYFDDIIEYSGRVIRKLENISLEAFREDEDAQDAIIRRFEVIGEATRRIPDEIKNRYPEIPWKDIVGFRNVLIHDYPEVIIDYVYMTAKEYLPVFKVQAEKILKDLKNQ